MIQKTYHLNNYTREKLEDILVEVASSSAYSSSAQTLLLMMEQNWDVQRIREKTALVRRILPGVEIAGTTHFDSIIYSPNGVGVDYKIQENTILTFLFFSQPAFTTQTFDLRKTETSVGEELKERFRSISDHRCVMTFFAGGPMDIGQILEEASFDVPVVGATAGVEGFFATGAGAAYVFDAEDVYKDTLLAVLFHGRDLHVMASHNCGWTSVGRTMTITKLTDPYTVAEIDGLPAADLYKKYLGIPWKQNRLSIANICEFPLVVERGGLKMARIPWFWDDGGNLHFAITMHKDEEIRLTYGLPQHIFSEVCRDADRYRSFVPQALFMIVCMNRMIFFRERAHEELDTARRIRTRST